MVTDEVQLESQRQDIDALAELLKLETHEMSYEEMDSTMEI
jgi:hypothetical protein